MLPIGPLLTGGRGGPPAPTPTGHCDRRRFERRRARGIGSSGYAPKSAKLTTLAGCTRRRRRSAANTTSLTTRMFPVAGCCGARRGCRPDAHAWNTPVPTNAAIVASPTAREPGQTRIGARQRSRRGSTTRRDHQQPAQPTRHRGRRGSCRQGRPPGGVSMPVDAWPASPGVDASPPADQHGRDHPRRP